jgi:hypothetical protein
MTPRRLLIALSALAILGLAAPAAASAKTVTKTCRGPATGTCTASFNLAGGASNVRLVVELPGTSYHRPKASVSPSSLKGAYSLTRGTFRLGGSEYAVTLNAVQSIRRGRLTLSFKPTS